MSLAKSNTAIPSNDRPVSTIRATGYRRCPRRRQTRLCDSQSTITTMTSSYDPEIHHRCSIRLKGYDYTRPGAYFITIVTQNRKLLFGKISNGEMKPNDFGEIVESCWLALPQHYPQLILDEFALLPAHVHCIMIIKNKSRHGIPEFVRAFKTFSARRINQQRKSPGTTVWQRDYYEHIIRDEDALIRIRTYIKNNPLNWSMSIDEL